jgi:hypothetical protein
MTYLRHPGLDPGSTFTFRRSKEGGCQIKSGMTKWGSSLET